MIPPSMLRKLHVLLACLMCAGGVEAAPMGVFGSSLASDGALGDISAVSSRLGNDPAYGIFINTDSGQVGWIYGGAQTPMDSGPLTHASVFSTVLTQNNGPSVRLFDFSTFTLPQNISLLIEGSMPAVVSASGDITINGTVRVVAGAAPGGAGGAAYLGPSNDGGQSGGGSLGGGGGQAAQGLHPVGCCFQEVSAGGGGGGGHVSSGQAGLSGYPVGGAQSLGGAGGLPATTLNTLVGGAGGGGGGDENHGPLQPGGSGGAGGGAVMFVTTGNMSVGSNGAIYADGVSAPFLDQTGAAAGGGGAGGTLWFNLPGIFTNYGIISARGGSGGADARSDGAFYSHGGGGSGGVVNIDPAQIINFGTLDVSDGSGGSASGGLVLLTAPDIINGGHVVGAATTVPEPSVVHLLLIGLVAGALGKFRRQ